MRQNALALIVILIFGGGCASRDASPPRDVRPSGAEEAQRDLAAGHLELRAYGLVAPADEAFAQLLQDRLGVRFARIAGCAVGGDEARRTDAYNRIMRAEIQRRFGRDSIARLREEAALSLPATRPGA